MYQKIDDYCFSRYDSGEGFWVLDLVRMTSSFKLVWFYSFRYQDVHNQSYIMVMASGRWLGVRLDLLASMLIGAVSLAAVLVSQDAGKYIFPLF